MPAVCAEAVIAPEIWDAVAAQLAANRTGHRRRSSASAPSLLAGLLIDSTGERLTPSHAVKDGRRYRYYVSQSLIDNSGSKHATGWRLPAQGLEEAVIGIINAALTDPGPLIGRLGLRDASAEQIRVVLDRAATVADVLLQGSPEERSSAARELIEQVIIDDASISIALRQRPLVAESGAVSETNPGETILISAPVAFRRRGRETKLILPASAAAQKPVRLDATLVKAIARGRLWFDQLAARTAVSLQAIAQREGVSPGYVGQLVSLAFLAPDIVEAILDGRQPAELSLTHLTKRLGLPLDWAQQRAMIRV